MGDLGFGQSFDSTREGKPHWAMKLLGEGMAPVGFGLPDWLFILLVSIPGLAKEFHRFIAYCSHRLDERISKQGKSDIPVSDPITLADARTILISPQDITHFLIDDFEKNARDKKAALSLLQADTRLIIVAGSDTTSATLVHIFLHLAANLEKQDQVRREVEALSVDGEAVNFQEAHLLDGTINEALRLNPPVPSGAPRKTPDEGIQIGDTYIPGNTIIQMPQYVMGHGEFTQPVPAFPYTL
jgi:tryprostatin B 6-hydroxylase